jgi:phage gp29-like protein
MEGKFMGFFDKIRDSLPWNVYARKEQELLELAKEFFGEAGVYKDDSYEMPDQEDFNPSDFDLDVYDKMLKDGQVKAGLDMIKLSATARGFTVTGDDAETRKYAEFINENFELIRGNMEDIIGEMLSALEYGYSCTEKVFDYRDGKIVLKKLKVLDPHTIRVKTDRFGDIEYVKQRIGSKTIKIPPQKVIWYAHDKRFGNLYGNSILRTVYKHWFIKDKMYRFANIAYERYGTPFLVGKVQDAKDVAKMRQLLSKINAMTGFAISGGDDIKAIQGSNADFVGYIEHHDRKIMEGMLVPPMLLGLSRGQSGSYALSGNQFDIFMIRLEALQRDLKALIEEEIIRPLIDLNFPNVKKYPAFNFKPLANEDIEKMARVFQMMIQAQVVAPSEEWIREELGFPVMSEETKQEIEERKKAVQDALRGQQNQDDEENEDNENNEEDSEGKVKK